MKHTLVNLSILLVLVMLLASCSVEKRRYMDGYHVEWFHHDRREVVVAEVADTLKKQVELVIPSPSVAVDDQKTPSIGSEDNISETIPFVVSADCYNIAPGPKPNLEPAPKEKRHREPVLKPSTRGYQAISTFSQKVDIDSSGKNVTAIIGFAFAVLAITCLLIAFWAAEGWAALGYIAIAFLFTLGASLFSFISLLLFAKAHEPLPWYEWIGLVIGVLGLYMALRIWVFKN